MIAENMKSVETFDTHIYYKERKKKISRWEKFKSFSLHFIFKCQSTLVPVCSCVRACASVSRHLLFRSRNTDGEVSLGVRGDEMQPNVEHGRVCLSLHSYNFITV